MTILCVCVTCSSRKGGDRVDAAEGAHSGLRWADQKGLTLFPVGSDWPPLENRVLIPRETGLSETFENGWLCVSGLGGPFFSFQVRMP